MMWMGCPMWVWAVGVLSKDKGQSHNCRTHSSCRVQAVGARGTRDNCKSKDKRSSA